MTMELSARGFQKIRKYEGYGKRQPDGSCIAYCEVINGKRDIPTIGYGCTKGVHEGMVWSAEQADHALSAELMIHEHRVNTLVTRPLNQNQFDALVSFDFNAGGLTIEEGAPSGVLRALNRGDDQMFEVQFKRWNKFGGQPSKGLTARRADELALFLEPVDEVATDWMPQAVEAPVPDSPWQSKTVIAASGGGIIAATQTVKEVSASVQDVKATGVFEIASHALTSTGVLMSLLILAFFAFVFKERLLKLMTKGDLT